MPGEYQMELFSDSTFTHQGDGQPSPIVFAILAGLQKVLEKKAKEQEEKREASHDQSDSSSATLVLNGTEPPLKAKSVDPASSSSQPNVDGEVKDER